MRPELLIGVVTVVGFLAGFLIICRRVRSGKWSPRRQQRLFRGTFYYGLGVLILFVAAQVYSGTVRWSFFAWWGFFLVSVAYAAFRRPSAAYCAKNYAQDSRHCGRCGCDLTGNVNGVCPACGWAIPVVPMQVEAPAWALWWNGWDIPYLENWRRTFLSTLACAVLFAVLTVWVLLRSLSAFLMAIIPAFLTVHLAVNAARALAYGRRQPPSSSP